MLPAGHSKVCVVAAVIHRAECVDGIGTCGMVSSASQLGGAATHTGVPWYRRLHVYPPKNIGARCTQGATAG